MRNYTSGHEQTVTDWGLTDLSDHALQSASAAVSHLTKAAVYATTADGYPADPDLADVFAAATCAQARWTRDLGTAGGAAALQGGASFMSLSLPGGGAASVQDVQARAYSPEAVTILANHGLLGTAVASGAYWGPW